MPQGRIKVGDIVERTGYSRYAMGTYTAEQRARRFGAIGVPLLVTSITTNSYLILEGIRGTHNPRNFEIKKRKHRLYDITYMRNELTLEGDYIIRTTRFDNLGAANVFIRDFPRDFPGYTIVAKKRVSYYINIPRG